MSENLLPTLLLVWVPYLLSSSNIFTEGLECYICDNCLKPEKQYVNDCLPTEKYCCKIIISRRQGTEVSRSCMEEPCDSVVGAYLGVEPPAMKTYSCRTNSCNAASAFDTSSFAALATGFSVINLCINNNC